MEGLADLHCVRVGAGTPRLETADADRLLAQLPGWRRTEVEGEARLEKDFLFENFARAMEFADGLARVAEAEDHHPALRVEWGRVNVAWWTHRIGGLHRNDFIMAARTETVFARCSPPSAAPDE